MGRFKYMFREMREMYFTFRLSLNNFLVRFCDEHPARPLITLD